MLATVRKFLLKLAIGAASGALVMVVAGQVIGLFAPGCTVVCQPDIAATLGGFSGAFAGLMVKGYEPG